MTFVCYHIEMGFLLVYFPVRQLQNQHCATVVFCCRLGQCTG